MVREYPALVITDARDASKNSGNPAFAHPSLCLTNDQCAPHPLHLRFEITRNNSK